MFSDIFVNIKSLLLDNKTVKQTIFKNTFWLALAEGLSKFFMLILLVYVARVLGATEYGKFTFALAFVSLFVIFSNFGLSNITIREFSRERKKEKEFPAIFTLKVLLSIATLILILLISFLVTSNIGIQRVIWVLAIFTVIKSFSEIIYAFLRARQQMQYEALAKILEAVVLVGAGFFVILNFPSIQNLSYSYLFASIITTIFILLFFHFKFFSLKLSFKKSIWKNFLLMSWPLGFVAVFATIYNQIDSVMMGYFGQITENGWYNAAHKLTSAALIPTQLIFTSFFPVLSIAFKGSKERLQMVWDHRAGMTILIAVPLVIGGVALASKIINFFYNPSFSPSILVFQILIITTGIIYFISPLSQALIISNQQKKNFWITFCGAMTNIILNLILIPKYSLYGAAIATLITVSLMLVLYFISTNKFTTVRPLNFRVLLTVFSAFLCSIPMYFAISRPPIYNLNILLSVLIGSAIYLVSFLILNNFLRLKII